MGIRNDARKLLIQAPKNRWVQLETRGSTNQIKVQRSSGFLPDFLVATSFFFLPEQKSQLLPPTHFNGYRSIHQGYIRKKEEKEDICIRSDMSSMLSTDLRCGAPIKQQRHAVSVD